MTDQTEEKEYDINCKDILYTLFAIINLLATTIFMLYDINIECSYNFRPIFIILTIINIIILIVKKYVYDYQINNTSILFTMYLSRIVWLILYFGLLMLIINFNVKKEYYCEEPVKIYTYITFITHSIVSITYCIRKIVENFCNKLYTEENIIININNVNVNNEDKNEVEEESNYRRIDRII